MHPPLLHLRPQNPSHRRHAVVSFVLVFSVSVFFAGRTRPLPLMTMNHLPAALIPIAISMPDAGAGFGLGVKVLVDQAASGRLGSPGIYGWGGAATTVFWIDPVEEVIGIFMTQFMPSGHYPVTTQFQRTVYQALVD